MSFTIASVNVNGIRAACKQRNDDNPGMNAWLETTPADVVLMQEVRANPEQTQKALAPALEAGWNLVQAESAAKGRAGVGILSKHALGDVSVGFGSFAKSGRFIAATVEGVRVASLYLPSGDVDSPKQDEKYRFLDEFEPLLEQWAGEYPDMVIGGDWNICHRREDLKNWKTNRKKSGFLPHERAFMDAIRAGIPDEVPTFWDMTIAAYWGWNCWDGRTGGFHSGQGAGGLGFAFPAALGGAVALAEKRGLKLSDVDAEFSVGGSERVVAVAGDGVPDARDAARGERRRVVAPPQPLRPVAGVADGGQLRAGATTGQDQSVG